jgi:predicted hydrocarbon binding protein
LAKEDQLVPQFASDPEGGTIVGRVLQSRVMAIGSFGWASLQSELQSTFMTGGSVILQRMGYSYGRYLAKQARQRALKAKETLTPASAMNIILESSRDQGWGRLSLNGGDFQVGTVNLVMKDCFFCLHEKKGASATCHFLVGIVVGVIDDVTGLSHKASEARCVSREDGLCEIRVERVAQQAVEPIRQSMF